jgi:hypothetical protein
MEDVAAVLSKKERLTLLRLLKNTRPKLAGKARMARGNEAGEVTEEIEL